MILDELKSPNALLSEAPKIIKNRRATAKCQHQTLHVKAQCNKPSQFPNLRTSVPRVCIAVNRGALSRFLATTWIFQIIGKNPKINKYFIDEKIDVLSSNIKNAGHFQNLLLDSLYKIINDFSIFSL